MTKQDTSQWQEVLENQKNELYFKNKQEESHK